MNLSRNRPIQLEIQQQPSRHRRVYDWLRKWKAYQHGTPWQRFYDYLQSQRNPLPGNDPILQVVPPDLNARYFSKNGLYYSMTELIAARSSYGTVDEVLPKVMSWMS